MMMPDQNEMAKRGVVQCMMSLARALQDAGTGLTQKHLEMTVEDFIVEIAGQNSIRFAYVRSATEDAPDITRMRTEGSFRLNCLPGEQI